MEINRSEHSAVESSIGYIFQWRYALLQSIEKLNNGHSFNLSIETLDDVTYEGEDGNLEITQIKHHITECKNLTNASTDLWRTFNIWFKLSKSGIDHTKTFFLITTATAPKNSAAYHLKPGKERNIRKSIELLEKTAKNSTNKENLESYKRFINLNPSKKLTLFRNIVVVDESINNNKVNDKIKSQIRLNVDEKYLDTYIKYIEGWWFVRVNEHLQKKDNGKILSEEIRAEIDDLREQFKRDDLPIAKDILRFEADESHLIEYKDYNFVCQLKAIEIEAQGILFAISDYYRAFTQRSRWVKSDLIDIGALDDYERRLQEEWKRRYGIMCRQLGENAAKKEKIKAAQQLYEWVEIGTLPLIRPKCMESFVSRGSYQDLANQCKVWWHPDFKKPEFLNNLKMVFEGDEAK